MCLDSNNTESEMFLFLQILDADVSQPWGLPKHSG